jgi:hypothetical protein
LNKSLTRILSPATTLSNRGVAPAQEVETAETLSAAAFPKAARETRETWRKRRENMAGILSWKKFDTDERQTGTNPSSNPSGN